MQLKWMILGDISLKLSTLMQLRTPNILHSEGFELLTVCLRRHMKLLLSKAACIRGVERFC